MNRNVILALLAMALLVGVIASGCNRKRDRDPSLAQSRQRNSSRKDLRKANSGSRPAEVLSASTQRRQSRQRQTFNPQQNGNTYYNDLASIPPITQSAAYYASAAPAPRVEPTYAMAAANFPNRSFATDAPAYGPLPPQEPEGTASFVAPTSYGPTLASAIYPQTDYAPALYQPSVYQPAAYQPSVYQPAVYQPAAYQSESYQTASYEPAQSYLSAPALAESFPANDYFQPGAIYDPPVQIQVLNSHPTPELALARAVLDTAPFLTDYNNIAPPPLPEVYVPSNYSSDLPDGQNFCPAAPIPELEPVRYQRAALTQPAIPELTPVMMSARSPEPTHSAPPLPEFFPGGVTGFSTDLPASYSPAVQYNSPLSKQSVPAMGIEPPQDWTPSPTTAMRTRMVYF